MKKMRKMVSLALTAAMTAGLMTGMGAMTASADSESTKITALLKGTESSEQYFTSVVWNFSAGCAAAA